MPSVRTPHDSARDAIERENRWAAVNPSLDPTDPRWVLAARVQSQLQGAMLTPERRDRILRTANHLGLNPFEASMIIALVQDQARRGGDVHDALDGLAEIRERPPIDALRQSRRRIAMLWIAASLLAVLAYSLLAVWLVNG